MASRSGRDRYSGPSSRLGPVQRAIVPVGTGTAGHRPGPRLPWSATRVTNGADSNDVIGAVAAWMPSSAPEFE
jgi:hypothetical protein